MDGRIGNKRNNHNRERTVMVDGVTVLARTRIGIIWASELGASRRVFSPGEIFCRYRLDRLGGPAAFGGWAVRYGHKGTLHCAKAVCREKTVVVFLLLLMRVCDMDETTQ